MPAYVALIRAVNVGGTGALPMAALRAACTAAGLRRVATYIASGNLLFESDATASEAKALIAGILRDRFGLARNPPIIRTPKQLAALLARNPFPDAAALREKLLYVHFLDGAPRSDAARTLAGHAGPERHHLDGDHLYIDFVTGSARSTLSPSFLAKALGVPTTGRNWTTTQKLLDLAQAMTQG